MSLIKYNRPLIPNWSSLMDSIFDDSLLAPNQMFKIPAANVTEQDTAYIITLAIPGLNKEDFNVEVDDNTITVSTEKEKTEESQEDLHTRKEYSYNSFRRSFTLPNNIKEDDIAATYTNGELILSIPKHEATLKKAKLIEVA